MATNTYVALDKVTVGTATPSITFSSISSSYTDLIIVSNLAVATAGTSLNMRFNSDTGSNYSYTNLYGDGSAADSERGTSATKGYVAWYVSPNTSIEMANITHIMNYSNSTTYKTAISRSNRASASNFPGTESVVSLWRNTNAITSITLAADSGNISVGSTFSLYGISAIGGVTPKATGGTVTSDATYWYHTFEMSGNFVPNQSLSCDYLVVAGGGGGGGSRGTAYGASGGGGAGGFRTGSAFSVTAQSYPITVGGGGVGGVATSTVGAQGTSGSNSVFSTITSTGGGGGGSGDWSTGSAYNGLTGGSGGGAGSGGTKGTGTSGQGFDGAEDATDDGGGGGGSSAGGSSPVSSNGGAGGAGTVSSISGLSISYAGGGGGGAYSTGSGGTATSGGGAGGANAVNGTAGTTNYGGGGGGSGGTSTYTPGLSGGNGGSGIVIVRYSK
jgi:hypothetical protein